MHGTNSVIVTAAVVSAAGPSDAAPAPGRTGPPRRSRAGRSRTGTPAPRRRGGRWRDDRHEAGASPQRSAPVSSPAHRITLASRKSGRISAKYQRTRVPVLSSTLRTSGAPQRRQLEVEARRLAREEPRRQRPTTTKTAQQDARPDRHRRGLHAQDAEHHAQLRRARDGEREEQRHDDPLAPRLERARHQRRHRVAAEAEHQRDDGAPREPEPLEAAVEEQRQPRQVAASPRGARRRGRRSPRWAARSRRRSARRG